MMSQYASGNEITRPSIPLGGPRRRTVVRIEREEALSEKDILVAMLPLFAMPLAGVFGIFLVGISELVGEVFELGDHAPVDELTNE